MAELNVKLLRETLKVIEDNPEKWYQAAWVSDQACGTAYCFAGWAAVLSGFPPPGRMPWVDENGRHVDRHAEKVLGLTGEQADVLFDANNNLDDLRMMVEMLTEDPDAWGEDLESKASWHNRSAEYF